MKTYKTVRYWKKFINEVLKPMDNMEMIKYLKENNFQRLSGSEFILQSRIVFALNDRVVIKVARNNAGLQQNYGESNVYYYLEGTAKKYFAKLYEEFNLCGNAVIMERVEPLKNTKVHNELSYKQREVLEKFHNNFSQKCGSIYNKDLFSDYFGMRRENFGIRGNQIVALDYGFSEYVQQMYRNARSDSRIISTDTIYKEFGLQTV